MQEGLRWVALGLVAAVVSLLSSCTHLPGGQPPVSPPNLFLQVRDPDIVRIAVQVQQAGKPARSYTFDARGDALVGGVYLEPKSLQEVVVTGIGADGRVIYRGQDQRAIGEAARDFSLPLRAENGNGTAIAHFTAERFVVDWTDEGGRIVVTPRLVGPTGKNIPFRLDDIRYGLNDVRRYQTIPSGDGNIVIVPVEPLPVCLEMFFCRPGLPCEPTTLCNPWVRIAAGGDHTCGITKSGAAYCWGRNADGELGSTTSTNCKGTPCSPWPVAVPCPAGSTCRYKEIAAGPTRSCAVDDQGLAWCWGAGSTPRVQWQAQLAGAAVKFRSITVGGGHACAISERDDVWCAGDNFYGQTGAPRSRGFIPFSAPVRLFGGTPFKKVTAGTAHSCAVSRDGTGIACWGDNTDNQIVDPGQPYRNEIDCNCSSQPVFRPLAFGPKVENIAAGTSGTCATLSSGETNCWGFNFNPLAFPASTPLERVTLGDVHACGISNGSAVCMGHGLFGQLGNGSDRYFTSPQSVTAPPQTCTEIGAGRAHTCAIDADGRAHCWGRNDLGQLGTGASIPFMSDVPRRVVHIP